MVSGPVSIAAITGAAMNYPSKGLYPDVFSIWTSFESLESSDQDEKY
jgi:hypothetical protein